MNLGSVPSHNTKSSYQSPKKAPVKSVHTKIEPHKTVTPKMITMSGKASNESFRNSVSI